MATRRTFARRESAGSGAAGRTLLGMLGVLLFAVVAFAVAVLVWSGASLASGSNSLATVSVQPFAGTLTSVRAFGPDGHQIPLSNVGGSLTPRSRLTPGERVTVEAVIERPGWSAWALGGKSVQRLTLHAPVAHVSSRWLTVTAGSKPTVHFDGPVAAVGYGNGGGTGEGSESSESGEGGGRGQRSESGEGGGLERKSLKAAARFVSLDGQPPSGTTLVAAAARPWERLGTPSRVVWFPASSTPMVVASPAPGSHIAPASPIRLMFSKPVADVLGGKRPTLSPHVSGHWRTVDSHTLQFTPSRFGVPFATTLTLKLPRAFDVAGARGGSAHKASELRWTVPPGSTLRLQQLLAQAGYLPMKWSPKGSPIARTPAAEVKAAVQPPEGSFSWRYPKTPSSLRALWSEGEESVVTKGAVMMFEHDHNMAVDGVAGRDVWRALINAAIAGKQHHGGYTYVYVHREIPETLTLWHNGKTVLKTPANTGISGAETELGTFPVFEHIPEGTMEGTNPDGSHYHDEGIKWISYFNGGDAIHNFDRASFGTPQSLGCVELPLQASAEVWPYTPIGTLVTIAG